MPISSGCVDGFAVAQQGSIDLQMALVRGDEADRAVPMLVVVPMHELRHPATRVQQAFNGLTGS